VALKVEAARKRRDKEVGLRSYYVFEGTPSPVDARATARPILGQVASTGQTAQRTRVTLILVDHGRTKGKSGKPAEGLRDIDEALAAIERTAECFYEAEVYRTRGKLILALASSNASQAEQSFHTAIEISRKQHAKSWELRATTSLAGLLRDTGRRDEARAMLAEIYGWFTEGFEFADLKDAQALLDELGA